MSTAAQPVHVDEPDAEVFISRQPVLDDQRRVTGYRISYAMSDGDERGVDSDHAAERLFGDVLSAVGLEELVGEALAHLPVSRKLLLTLGIPPVRPDRVILRLAYEPATDPELRQLIESLAGRGYSLSLYDLPGPDFDVSLLRLFGTVEIDCSAWTAAEVQGALSTIIAERATSVAVGLIDSDHFERARQLGFHLFAGPFFASPKTAAVRNVPVGSVQALVSLARLQGAGAEIEELERVIDHDLGLSVKLLRYINSAYFGMRSKITSIRQAVMMLGSRGVSRWAMMVALTGGPTAPRELSVMALTRARMCEILGGGRADVTTDELFTIGLLSLADALLDTPLEKVLVELPLVDEVSDALLHRAGPAGEILDAVISYERGSFTAEAVQAYRGGVARAYLDALSWAQRTLSEVT
jgi:c-di-GMP phosphodiesterase